MAVVANVNSGKYDFFGPTVNQSLNFAQDFMRLNASTGTAGVRNEAVCAKAVAAVLNLKKGSGLTRFWIIKKG